MKTLIRVLIFSFIFLAVAGFLYFQILTYSGLQNQLSLIRINQKMILQELRAMKTQQQFVNIQKNIDSAKLNLNEQTDENQVYQIDIGSSPVKGNKNAEITLIEFSDFQCPYSQMFHPLTEQILKEYPDKVKIVLKNFPLSYHQWARLAVKVAFAAKEQGKYWEMVEAIFKEGKNLSQQKFEELAKNIGLDVNKFKQDLMNKDKEWERLIEEDIAAANKAQVGGTPTFFINGKKVRGGSLEDFKKVIEEILRNKK